MSFPFRIVRHGAGYKGRSFFQAIAPSRARSFRTFQCNNKEAASSPARIPTSPFKRRTGNFAIALLFTGAGFIMASLPNMQTTKELLNPPSDQETLTMFVPADESSKGIEAYIQNHQVAISLRSRPELSESRPHLKIPESHRNHLLTGGVLMGPEKVAVPPIFWSEEGGKSLVSIAYLGADLCGHPGIIHGGLIATMLDEGLARCSFGALPNKIGLTANLNINYRSPAKPGSFVVLRAKTVKVEGRKAWVEGHIETLVDEGEKPVILAEATGLFIEPKQAATMARVYPVA